MAKPGYIDRVIQHHLLWVNGTSKHNHVDDECLIDFSCCNPELFEKDLEKRRKTHAYIIEQLRTL